MTADIDALVKKLEAGVVYRVRRWSGDTHTEFGGSVDDEATEALLREASRALVSLQAERDAVPACRIECETREPGLIGSTDLNVVRVEREDDGSLTVVTDYWPRDGLYQRQIEDLQAERDGIAAAEREEPPLLGALSLGEEGLANLIWQLSLGAQAELDNGDAGEAAATLVCITEAARAHVQSMQQRRNAPTTPSPSVRDDGWQLVPKEPTEEMLDRAQFVDGTHREVMRVGYRAMLAAAPAASSPTETVEELARVLERGIDVVSGTWDGIYQIDDEIDWVKDATTALNGFTAHSTAVSPIASGDEGGG